MKGDTTILFFDDVGDDGDGNSGDGDDNDNGYLILKVLALGLGHAGFGAGDLDLLLDAKLEDPAATLALLELSVATELMDVADAITCHLIGSGGDARRVPGRPDQALADLGSDLNDAHGDAIVECLTPEVGQLQRRRQRRAQLELHMPVLILLLAQRALMAPTPGAHVRVASAARILAQRLQIGVQLEGPAPGQRQAVNRRGDGGGGCGALAARIVAVDALAMIHDCTRVTGQAVPDDRC